LAVARNWPALMVNWAEREKRFLSSPYKTSGFPLSFKIRFTATVVIILAFVEHALFLANAAHSHSVTVERCNWIIDAPLSYFLEHQFWFFFSEVKFNLPLGILVEVLNMSYTFGWNFMELFVMIVSIGLVTRFWQINERLDSFKGKVKNNCV